MTYIIYEIGYYYTLCSFAFGCSLPGNTQGLLQDLFLGNTPGGV